MNLIKYLIVLLFVAVCGCEKQDPIQEPQVIKRRAVDMSDASVNKRWFERRFQTPYSNLKNIDGDCLSWGMSGRCRYVFEVVEGAIVELKSSYDVISCSEIYERLFEVFNEDDHLRDSNNLFCRKSISDNDDIYWISIKSTSKHFVWEQFEND